jgi:histidyl-tRNA synthetase
MRDLLPDEAAAFDALQAVTQARALSYGYPRIVTPIVEEREVFLKSVGESSDIVGKEMYDVTYQGQGKLALRPEGTAAVTRALLEHGLHKAPRPVRFFYWEPMFRGQRPQLLRYRQFWQWGLECFGVEEPGADAEIIDFTARLFAEVGLTHYDLEINTLGDARCQSKVKDALTAHFAKNRDALSEDSRRRLDTNPLRILDSKDPRDRELVASAPAFRELLCAEDREHFERVTSALDRLGHRYRVVETMVRGLDYYTRTVFEFVLADPEFKKGGDIAVAAGGRYDGLVETMGGPSMPGVGIAGGVDVLYGALKQEGARVGRETTADVYVLSAETGDGADRLQIADPLRAAGFTVAVDYSDRPLDKQLESAVKHGAKVAVIRGTPEQRGGNLIVRDLITKTQRVTRGGAVVTEVGRHVPRHEPPPLYTGPANLDELESGAAGEAPFLRDDRD